MPRRRLVEFPWLSSEYDVGFEQEEGKEQEEEGKEREEGEEELAVEGEKDMPVLQSLREKQVLH